MIHRIAKIPSIKIADLRGLLVGVLMLAVLVGFGSVGRASAQKTPAARSPVTVVKNLYAAHNNGRGNVFTRQSKEILHKFFDHKLAELIWKELNHQPEDEVGNLDFDPLYNSQDVQISKFQIGKPRITGNKAIVPVSFDNYGKLTRITFPLIKTGAGWKIQNVNYEDGSNLIKILSAPH